MFKILTKCSSNKYVAQGLEIITLDYQDGISQL